MLYIDHEYQQAPPPYGHEGPVGDIGKMHGHGSARAERVRPDIFWGKFKFGRAHLSGIGPEGCYDVRGADRAVSMVGVRVVADRSGPWASMSAHAEEDVDA